MATTFDGLSKWGKLALIFLGLGYVLFLFSCGMPGWNAGGGVRGFGGDATSTSVVGLGVASLLFAFLAIMSYLGCMQSELNQIAYIFVCILSLLAGLMMISCVGLFETTTHYFSPVSTSVAIFAGLSTFLAGVFVIIHLVKGGT